MTDYEAAVTMYHREHDRWHQWALFFYAGIGATFYVASQFHLPLWVASLVAAAISLAWVFAASSIRASTDAWKLTITYLEGNRSSTTGAFTLFKRTLDTYDFRGEFVKVLTVWRRKTFLSVTRLLVLSGLIAFLLFIALSVLDFVCDLQAVQP